VTEPRAKIAGLGPSGHDRCRTPPNSDPAVAFESKLRPGAIHNGAANLHGWTADRGYNVCMSFEDDETSAISDQQPGEPEDQFEEDLMRDLERQQSSPTR